MKYAKIAAREIGIYLGLVSACFLMIPPLYWLNNSPTDWFFVVYVSFTFSAIFYVMLGFARVVWKLDDNIRIAEEAERAEADIKHVNAVVAIQQLDITNESDRKSTAKLLREISEDDAVGWEGKLYLTVIADKLDGGEKGDRR